MQKVSFDFDGTLGEPYVQVIAQALINLGVEVWVLTARQHDNVYDEQGGFLGYNGMNSDIRRVCSKLSIEENKILYTNGAFKHTLFKEHKFELHLDDDWKEVELIRRNGGKALLVDFSVYDLFNEIDSTKGDVEIYLT